MRESITRKVITATLACALAAAPLAGCTGDAAKSDATRPEDAATTTETPQASETETTDEKVTSYQSLEPKDTTKVDFSAWKTLGDAFRETDDFSSAYNFDETELVAAFDVAGGHVIVKAKMTPEVYSKTNDISYDDVDANQKQKDALGELAIDELTDISSETVSDDELAGFVGKTAKELEDAGFTFAGYTMYGGSTTCASFDKGYYRYEFNFEKQLAEDQVSSDDSAIKNAKIASVEPDHYVNDKALALTSETEAAAKEGAETGETIPGASDLIVTEDGAQIR